MIFGHNTMLVNLLLPLLVRVIISSWFKLHFQAVIHLTFASFCINNLLMCLAARCCMQICRWLIPWLWVTASSVHLAIGVKAIETAPHNRHQH